MHWSIEASHSLVSVQCPLLGCAVRASIVNHRQWIWWCSQSRGGFRGGSANDKVHLVAALQPSEDWLKALWLWSYSGRWEGMGTTNDKIQWNQARFQTSSFHLAFVRINHSVEAWCPGLTCWQMEQKRGSLMHSWTETEGHCNILWEFQSQNIMQIWI